MAKPTEPGGVKDRIVSSSHLAKGNLAAVSELEYGLIVAYNAFQRWITHCMAASGNHNLSALEVIVLHNVNHRERAKRVADICFALNIEDTHTVTYALKKLARQNLVEGDKRGKEIFYSTTQEGAGLCATYGNVRSNCLMDDALLSSQMIKELESAAKILRTLSGAYDQAARGAASY